MIAERRYVLVMILSIFKCSVFSRFIKNIDQVQPVLGTLRCHDGRRQRERQKATLHVHLTFCTFLYSPAPLRRENA